MEALGEVMSRALAEAPLVGRGEGAWQPLEAKLFLLSHLLRGLSPHELAALPGHPACVPFAASLAALPPQRALWRATATCAAVLAPAFDAAELSSSAFACFTCAARTLHIAVEGDDEAGEAAYPFVAEAAGGELVHTGEAEGEQTMHAGAAALWRMCDTCGAAPLARLASQAGVFDGVMAAHAAAHAAADSAKAAALLKAACVLARASENSGAGGEEEQGLTLTLSLSLTLTLTLTPTLTLTQARRRTSASNLCARLRCTPWVAGRPAR